MPRKATQSERRSAKDNTAKAVEPLTWKGPGFDKDMIAGLSQEDLKNFRTWLDYCGDMAYWSLILGFLWCDLGTWLITMFLDFNMHYYLQIAAQAMELEKVLPLPWRIFFEETSIAINKCAVQRYVKPFVRVGNTVATGFIMWAWAFSCGFFRGNFMVPAAAAFSRVCLALRAWRRTRKQYQRKREQQMASDGQQYIDRLVEEATLKMIIDIYPAAYWDSCMLPMELRVERSKTLREGRPSCCQLVNGMLADVSRMRPVPLARLNKLPSQEKICTQRYISWSKARPLVEQWRIAEAVLSAADSILLCQDETCTLDAFLNSTVDRQAMVINVKRARKQMELFRELIIEVLGPKYDVQSMISALIEVDRSEFRGARSEDSPPEIRRKQVADIKPSTISIEAEFSDQDSPVCLPAAEILCDVSLDGNEDRGAIHECVACFENPAVIVFSKCGHLTYCKMCRRKALRQALGCDWNNLESYARRLRRPMSCPVCRSISPATEVSKYQGVVYKC